MLCGTFFIIGIKRIFLNEDNTKSIAKIIEATVDCDKHEKRGRKTIFSRIMNVKEKGKLSLSDRMAIDYAVLHNNYYV